jgi:hypothetical protein
MPSTPLRRSTIVLALLLAALVALPTAGLAAPGHATIAKAKKKKVKCKSSKSSKKKKGCAKKKKKAKVPALGKALTGANNAHVTIVALRPRGGKPQTVVQVSLSGLPAHCTSGFTYLTGGTVGAPLKGTSFSGKATFPQGNFTSVSGHFVSAKKVTGVFQVGNLPVPDRGVCDTGPVPFTATG